MSVRLTDADLANIMPAGTDPRELFAALAPSDEAIALEDEARSLARGTFRVTWSVQAANERADWVFSSFQNAWLIPVLLGVIDLLKKYKREASTLLREVEWLGAYGTCPTCYCSRDEGHKPECRLAALLASLPREGEHRLA